MFTLRNAVEAGILRGVELGIVASRAPRGRGQWTFTLTGDNLVETDDDGFTVKAGPTTITIPWDKLISVTVGDLVCTVKQPAVKSVDRAPVRRVGRFEVHMGGRR